MIKLAGSPTEAGGSKYFLKKLGGRIPLSFSTTFERRKEGAEAVSSCQGGDGRPLVTDVCGDQVRFRIEFAENILVWPRVFFFKCQRLET